MDSKHRYIHNHQYQSLPTIKNQQNSTNQSPVPPSVSDNGFPVLAIAGLGILASAFILISYCIFITKCCLNWQEVDPLRRFSFRRARRNDDPLITYSPSWQSRGLDELLIREIPTFQYSRGEERSLSKCVVCLSEFQDQDLMRVLPNCSHGFHLDCIDIWLQSNANCPLCRTSISGTTRNPIDRIMAPTSSPQDSHPLAGSLMGSDEDFVVIELSGEDGNNSREHLVQSRKFEQNIGILKPRKCHHVSIMGDECIDVREKDDQFSIQPIRRSFSMDSAVDRHVYLSVQEIISQNRHLSEVRNNEECSNRICRSFFSFRHGRGSRSAVLPLEF